MTETAIRIVEKYYDLGTILNARELTGGYCNQSFFISTQKRNRRANYLVRRYNPKTEEKELIFEHALIGHLIENGFTKVAGIIPQKSGATYMQENPESGGRKIPIFWAVFEFLEGEDRYTWTDSHVHDDDMISAAGVLAELHSAGYNFRKPPGADRVQPKISDFLPGFGKVYDEFAKRVANTSFHKSFLKNRREIAQIIQNNLIPESELPNLPQLPIHCDFHQGNLKYENSRVIGVFDFDWSKIDLRIFDLGLSLVYFCAVWEGSRAGTLNLDKCKLYLQTYHQACATAANPGKLTRLEKKYLPSMMAAGNLYVLHWTIVDYYSIENPDDDEYMKYLNHGVNLMKWIEGRKNHIAASLDLLGG
jgi:homoserine kinase type II